MDSGTVHPHAPRILVVMTQAEYQSNGGATSAAELAIHAARAGSDVHVITSHESDLTRVVRAAGVTVDVLPALAERRLDRGVLRHLFSGLSVHRRVALELRRRRYDVVQANDRRAFWTSCAAARLAGIPIVDVVRDTLVGLSVLRLKKWQAEFRLASRVMVLSSDMAERWAEGTATEVGRFHPIYSIVDLQRFRPVPEPAALRAELGLPETGPIVVYPAGLRKKKRQLDFIEGCLPGICRSVPDVTVCFVGDHDPAVDPYSRACSDAVLRAGIKDSVRFAGHRKDVEKWYQVADVTVLASEKEGMARGMLESIACGTPMVSFDVSSAREILERNASGLVVPNGDFAGLAAALLAIIQNPSLRSAMSVRGRETATRLFSADSVVGAYLGWLNETIGRGSLR